MRLSVHSLKNLTKNCLWFRLFPFFGASMFSLHLFRFHPGTLTSTGSWKATGASELPPRASWTMWINESGDFFTLLVKIGHSNPTALNSGCLCKRWVVSDSTIIKWLRWMRANKLEAQQWEMYNRKICYEQPFRSETSHEPFHSWLPVLQSMVKCFFGQSGFYYYYLDIFIFLIYWYLYYIYWIRYLSSIEFYNYKILVLFPFILPLTIFLFYCPLCATSLFILSL